MKSWFKGSGSSGPSKASSIFTPSRNASTNQVALSPRDAEIDDLQDAMAAASKILNDDVEGAEAQLRARSSSFHSLGLGIALFMRSILGFEKDIMAEASLQLADCEARAWADMKKAQKLADGGGGGGGWFRGVASSGAGHVSGHGCEIYPPGTEFQLLNAQAQLMGAVVAVMNESLTEAIKGFYKLRKAFVALDAILEAEAKVLPAVQSNGAAKSPVQEQETSAEEHKPSDSDSDLEFVDAAEDTQQSPTPVSYAGNLERVNSKSAPGSILEKDLNDLNLADPPASSVPTTRPDTPTSQNQSNEPFSFASVSGAARRCLASRYISSSAQPTKK